jgi:hypothetical protein
MFVEVLALASGEAERKLYQAIESLICMFCKSAAMMRLSESKANLFAFAERKHLRNFRLQN